MKPLPLPVRLAAGIVALAVEQARDLPRLVIEFPVTAVSQALQASMRVQQKVTEVAIKGDRALGALRPVEETPSWATFDEDEPSTNGNGSGTVTSLRPQPRTRPPGTRVTRTPPPPAAAPPAPAKAATPTRAPEKAPAPAPEKAAPEKAAPDAPSRPRTAQPVTVRREPKPAPAPKASAADAPAALPEYPELSIPQLRAKLRTLSLGDLRVLLAWEQSHESRPPFVTMLSNRITTVSEA
ncbi:lipid droplet-associated protein [Pseudonocardia saturnea]